MSSGPLTKPNNRVEIGSDYTATTDDRLLIVTSLTAPLTITLADPTVVGRTEGLLVKDETGLCSGLLPITILPSVGTFQGASSFVISTAYGAGRFYSSGDAWFFV